MNKFVSAMSDATNFTRTENGAITHKTTKSDLLDMFAMGAAYRTRSDDDVILMFQKAYKENPEYALKCLFYIRDVRGGQGERRFFRVVMKYLANYETEAVLRNLKYIPEFGRWDDLYVLEGTKVHYEVFNFMKEQLALDITCKTPSLLAKWLKSENTSSNESRKLAYITRKAFGLTSKQYRKTLSMLRERINIVERLMSENRWDEIEFDKIPSRAGMIYKNAFARHDIERMKLDASVQSYADFAKDTTKTVNAKALYPYECVAEAMKVMRSTYGYYGHKVAIEDTQRLMVNKYWDNLADYFQKATFNGMAIVDTSGSMCGPDASAPINVAISLGLYCAEKAKGPYANHFITFSSNPKWVKTEGVDFCDKVVRMSSAEWGGSTNIEAAFDMILDVAIKNRLSQDEIPENLIVISDMEFNSCVTSGARTANSVWGYSGSRYGVNETLFESMKRKWQSHGYQLPKLTFWNVQARQNNIPMTDDGNVRYVSGMSPVIFEQVMKNLTAYDLMMDKLDSERYTCIK
jgi:hypothetical protein